MQFVEQNIIIDAVEWPTGITEDINRTLARVNQGSQMLIKIMYDRASRLSRLKPDGLYHIIPAEKITVSTQIYVFKQLGKIEVIVTER